MKRTFLLSVFLILVAALAMADAVRLDLEQFLQLVERNSLQLEGARIERGFAETDVAITRSITRPMIGAQASLTRSLLEVEQPLPGGGTMIIDPSNDLNFGVSLQQLIFDLRAFRALEASRQADTLTTAIYEATRQGILTGAKKLFYQAVLLGEMLEVRRAAEDLARDGYEEVLRRHEAGVASRLDLLRAELNWRATVPETTQADRNLQVVLASIRSFAGIDADSELEFDARLDTYPPMPRFDAIENILGERPDYQALEGTRSLRELGVAAQRAEFYPSLSGSITYGWSANDEGLNFADPIQRVTAGLQLQLPLYTGGARAARLRRARLELDGSDTELQKKIDEVRTELRTIELTLSEAASRIESAGSTVNTAELAYEMTQLSVDGGVSTQLELKDARVSLVSARLTFYAAIYDYLSAYFDWQAATGRGADLVP